MDGRLLKEFLSLPVNPDETWQGGVATLSDLMGIPPVEAPSRIGLILWRGVPSELVHAKPVMSDADDAFDQFVDTMLELSEEHEFPYRPAQIDCNDRQFADDLNRHLDGSGTVVHYRAKMGDWNTVVRELAEHVQSVAPPSLPSLREAGCSDEQLREYAAAAAELYRAKLWEVLDDTDLIKIETPRPPRLMKYAVVLGAGAQSYGLGLYQDDEDHYGLMAQEIDPRQMNLFSFVYESPPNVASGDVELWKELDLPWETGEAFPDANLFSPDGTRRPTPKEVDFLTIVLKGLAQTSEEELDSGHWTQWVQVSGKRRKCVFSIPNLVDPPDRAEWIRRGKMPDRRGHEIHFRQVQEFIDSVGGDMDIDELNEAINAQFTGRSLDDYELPRNTPAEHAEALYQDALGVLRPTAGTVGSGSFERRSRIMSKLASWSPSQRGRSTPGLRCSRTPNKRRPRRWAGIWRSWLVSFGDSTRRGPTCALAKAWRSRLPLPVKSATRSSNTERCSDSIPMTTRACVMRLSRCCSNKIATPKPSKCSTNTRKSLPNGCT